MTTSAIEKSQAWKDPSCIGAGLVENLLHERAYSLDHFEYDEQIKKAPQSGLSDGQATDSILRKANNLTSNKKTADFGRNDENRIKREID